MYIKYCTVRERNVRKLLAEKKIGGWGREREDRRGG
jgi:hypothetical protein